MRRSRDEGRGWKEKPRKGGERRGRASREWYGGGSGNVTRRGKREGWRRAKKRSEREEGNEEKKRESGEVRERKREEDLRRGKVRQWGENE
eukprot:1860804-Rhodomonas_salina.3